MLTVDNSGRGNCMYYAYSISLMYFLRAKNNEQITKSVFSKLKLSEIQKTQLLALIASDPLQEFTEKELKQTIEPILGRAVRDLAAEQTKIEFIRAPQSSSVFTATQYGLEYYFQEAVKIQKPMFAQITKNKFNNRSFTEAEIYRIDGIKRAIQDFIQNRKNEIVTAFENQWAIKEEEFKTQNVILSKKDIEFHQEIILNNILREKTISFFLDNNNKYLNQYTDHLKKEFVWGTEETLMALNRAVQGERFERNQQGTIDTFYDVPITLHIYTNNRPPPYPVGNPELIINNRNNGHWTSKIPESIFDSQAALAERRRLEEEKRAIEKKHRAERQEPDHKEKELQAEEKRRLEEKKRVDEETRRLEQKKQREEEKRRLEQEKQFEDEQHRLEQKKFAEKHRLEKEKQIEAEQRRLEQKKRHEEEQRRLEQDKQRKEQSHLEKEKRLDEQRRLEQEKWLEEQNRLQEEKRLEKDRQFEQEKLLEEQRRLDREKRLEERRRLRQEQRLHWERRVAQEKKHNEPGNLEPQDLPVINKKRNIPNRVELDFNYNLALLNHKVSVFSGNPKFKKAHKAALDLYAVLKREGERYFQGDLSLESYQQFKDACEKQIETAHQELDRHRGVIKILLNILAIILTAGVGYAIAAGISIAMDKEHRFKFFSTGSCLIANALEDNIKQAAPNKPIKGM